MEFLLRFLDPQASSVAPCKRHPSSEMWPTDRSSNNVPPITLFYGLLRISTRVCPITYDQLFVGVLSLVSRPQDVLHIFQQPGSKQSVVCSARAPTMLFLDFILCVPHLPCSFCGEFRSGNWNQEDVRIVAERAVLKVLFDNQFLNFRSTALEVPLCSCQVVHTYFFVRVWPWLGRFSTHEDQPLAPASLQFHE